MLDEIRAEVAASITTLDDQVGVLALTIDLLDALSRRLAEMLAGSRSDDALALTTWLASMVSALREALAMGTHAQGAATRLLYDGL